MKPDRPPRELFLSHSSRNRRFATRLRKVLTNHGIPVWYSDAHIKGADRWHDKIGAALERCDWFLVVVSPSAVGSHWVRHELLYALDEPRYVNRIVPVLYRKCNVADLSWTLRAMQMVDFTRKFDDGCRELLKIWSVDYVPGD